jgi:hypothetical protein
MRKAAGIILIIYGAISLFFFIPVLLMHLHLPSDPVLNIFFIISNAFIVTGGVFCLKRKYWKLCFASTLLTVLLMIYWIYGLTGFRFPPPASIFPALDWCLLLLTIIAGALPIIFVCLRKSEWQEISA